MHLKARARAFLRPPTIPITARHLEWSVIASVDDLEPKPSPALIDLMLAGAAKAREVNFDDLASRSPDARWLSIWPGAHYRLLAGLCDEINATKVIEVGTYLGLGALAMGASGSRQVITYDLIPLNAFPNVVATAADLAAWGIEQRLGNLLDEDFFRAQVDDLRTADLLFIDGPKDGHFEKAILLRLIPYLKKGAVLVLDDIRLLNMLATWRWLPLPKLDATSVGHWCGTGMAIA